LYFDGVGAVSVASMVRDDVPSAARITSVERIMRVDAPEVPRGAAREGRSRVPIIGSPDVLRKAQGRRIDDSELAASPILARQSNG
jgi:hypothetical protein